MKPSSPLKVLLVEDNPGDADLVSEALSEFPERVFDIHRVASLAEAENILSGERFDAVLLDLNLPESSGVETVRRAKKLPSGAPLIVRSGVLDDAIRVDAIRAGAQDVVGKDDPAPQHVALAILHSVERQRGQERAHRVDEIVSVMPDAVVVVDGAGSVQFVNEAAERFFARPRSDFVGRPFGFAVDDGRAVEVVGTGGRVRVGEMRVARFDWDGQPAYLASVRDVTEEMHLRKELDATQVRLQRVLSSSAAILLSRRVYSRRPFDLDYAFAFVSEGVTRVLGYTVEEALQERWFAENIHPEDIAAVTRSIPVLLTGVTQELSFRFRRRDGDYRWIDAQLASAPTGDPSSAEIVSVWLDVTDRRSLESQLEVVQRMESLGMLAGGVAHDFNNMLTVVFSSADRALDLMRSGNGTDDARIEVEEIRQSAERAAALTRQLLAFSRQQVLEPRIANLNDIANSTGELLHRLIAANIGVVLELEPDLKPVFVDPNQVEQIIVNLAVNARDAMPNGGTLTIETANVFLDASYAEDHPYVTPGEHVVLSVTDTGIGMDQETQARIFEPFYTTKEVGKGTGLGLASVYGIAKQSDGHIHVYSELGEGTTFRVYFPRAYGNASGQEDAPKRDKVVGGSETILFVEDDPRTRRAGVSILNRLGYRVLVAENGEHALMVARDHEGAIDLLVTDVVMPLMGGAPLAERLREIRPETSILFISGYSRDAVVQHVILTSDSAFLQKPYTPDSLGRRVREVLDRRGDD